MGIARVISRGESLETCGHEEQRFWKCLPSHEKARVSRLVAAAAEERKQVNILWNALDRVLEMLFAPAFEASIVRPLSQRLGCILPLPRNLLEASVTAADLVPFEGSSGGVELFHPCAEDPTKTKYEGRREEGGGRRKEGAGWC